MMSKTALPIWATPQCHTNTPTPSEHAIVQVRSQLRTPAEKANAWTAALTAGRGHHSPGMWTPEHLTGPSHWTYCE